ncbi:EAL domain-containing protein [Arthrobacter sp. UYCu712]|uniref:EAL domain-containing protein n=1 Tax=Arthrobacter sp. UYCu712 TaxID=3156340 RepID=UPI003391AE87
MSTDPSNFPSCSDNEQPEVPGATEHPEAGASRIRRQAAEIVKAVLAQTSPEHAGVRDQLREYLALNPGHPEIALAEHLVSLGTLADYTGGFQEAQRPPSPAGEDYPAEAGPAGATSRILSVLAHRTLLTAFQPIFDLSSDAVVGVEAFTRFIGDGSEEPGQWFAEAASAELGSELEFAALESAIVAARSLPGHLYVALKISPACCLDPLLPELLQESELSLGRIVLQLTEALTDEEAVALVAALAPLRARGVRLAVDHVGSYFASLRHVKQLQPDIIKLDRNLIAGVDTDPLRHAFAEAMAGLAGQIGASATAEGIETSAELAAVTGLGMTTGQGYFLGRPSTRPEDWNSWVIPADKVEALTDPDTAARS